MKLTINAYGDRVKQFEPYSEYKIQSYTAYNVLQLHQIHCWMQNEDLKNM